MYTFMKKQKITLISMLYGMMISMPAMAEDIEIYRSASTSTTATQPNVLFVLDTSGSMSTDVETREPYDPATDYSGGDACYASDRVYAIVNPYSFLAENWQGETNAEILCGFSTNGFNTYVRQVNRTAVVCNAASSLDSTGFYTGNIAQYRNNDEWDGDLAVDDLTGFIECEADSGEHGETASSTAKYASQNSPPAWSSEPNEINWGNVGNARTLYTGRYLNYIITVDTVWMERIDIMKNVMTDLVNSTSGINIGLMRFSRNGAGGQVVVPVADIGPVGVSGAGTQRQLFLDELNRMTPRGVTPLSESYYEAVMYYQGKSVDYGLNSTEAGSWPGNPYPSVPASRTGNTYISPITNECQKNFVVLLTDGDPYYDGLNTTRKNNIDSGLDNTAVSGSNCGNSNNCLDEIAESIGNNDQSTLIDGDQVISTFTIGFGNQNVLLQDTADASKAATGTGERFFADDATSLAESLSVIVENVYEANTTFSSPVSSVNAFNRAVHLNDMFFTVFSPDTGTRWAGNLKKYKLDFINGNAVITDGNNNPAISSLTGYFDDDAQSFWSDDIDGAAVTSGGVAGELANLSSRNVYTFTGSYTNTNGVFAPGAAASNLTSTNNAVDESNAAIVDGPSMLNITGLGSAIAGTPRRETLLGWAAGMDVFDLYGADGDTTDMRPEMGDPLHSQVAVVQYGEVAVSGEPDDVPDLVAYVATNDGYLHAIDAYTGVEIFSFIPQELLSNLNGLMDNNVGSKTYGLDGDVVSWVNDINGDGTIDGADSVYLYVGMRRGGSHIYSLDVTDREVPILRWVIKGGIGDYANLGQTWSTVNVETIKDGATEKQVIIFGGGYDTNQDNANVRDTDTVGNSVFIADAESGELLWSGGPSGDTTIAEMQYSIPARVKPLDLSGDGFIDRLYVADTGGQVFRFDIDNKNDDPLVSSITGGRIADLAEDGDITAARRFYYPPDVALIAERGKSAYLALAIASGYRAHPNDTDIRDRIYLLKDNDIYNTPDPYVTLTEADLYNATGNLAGNEGVSGQNTTVQDNALAALDTAQGWYIHLDDETADANWVGEKGLSEALILEGAVIVTTFVPADGNGAVDSCSPQSGISKIFYMEVTDATPVPAADNEDREGRHLYDVLVPGIVSRPTTWTTTEGTSICTGTQCENADVDKGTRRTFWNEVEMR